MAIIAISQTADCTSLSLRGNVNSVSLSLFRDKKKAVQLSVMYYDSYATLGGDTVGESAVLYK